MRNVKSICTTILPLTLFLSGCINTVAGSPVVWADADRSAPWYVVRHAKDGRDLAATIAGTLREHGVAASSGYATDQPAAVHRTVHYTDKWYWDMRMYLMELRVEVRDPRTGAVLGWGESVQSSLAAMGKSHEDVVGRAIGELLGDFL